MTTQTFPQQIFNNCKKAVPALRLESLAERKKRLRDLRTWIHTNRADIHQAVYADFGKPSMETDATEIFHVLNEIKVALTSLDRWAAPKKVDAPLYMIGTRSWVHYESRGVCLIISPWNYPFSLAVGPLVSALAAGNAAVIKPSEITPSVSALIKRMCDQLFDASVVSVCEGGAEISKALLALPFDHIFFTGSTHVGKIVMKAAAENLSSVTLELGGKSPAIIAEDARLSDTAERIAVGKFINNGQTCIAPDYLLVHEKVLPELVKMIVRKATTLYANTGDFTNSPDYGRIVSDTHFGRLETLLDDACARGANVEWDGPRDRTTRFMHPVLLSNVHPESRMMQEEIFGPILPLIPYKTIREAIDIINFKPKPLALYVFSSSRAIQDEVLRETSSGTACINDCGVQFLHHNLPFGGINNSGMGKSHGHYGFLTFSHEKAVLKQKGGATSVRAFYPPFTGRSKQLMDWFLKLF